MFNRQRRDLSHCHNRIYCSWIGGGRYVRCVAAITTNLVDEACPASSGRTDRRGSIGRSLTGALLMGGGLKDLEKVTVRFKCDGVLEGI